MKGVPCHYSATGAGDVHAILGDARRLELSFRVDWGGDDVRDSHEKPMVFCSFGCLSKWAAERADQHDQVTVAEGVAPAAPAEKAKPKRTRTKAS